MPQSVSLPTEAAEIDFPSFGGCRLGHHESIWSRHV